MPSIKYRTCGVSCHAVSSRQLPAFGPEFQPLPVGKRMTDEVVLIVGFRSWAAVVPGDPVEMSADARVPVADEPERARERDPQDDFRRQRPAVRRPETEHQEEF